MGNNSKEISRQGASADALPLRAQYFHRHPPAGAKEHVYNAKTLGFHELCLPGEKPGCRWWGRTSKLTLMLKTHWPRPPHEFEARVRGKEKVALLVGWSSAICTLVLAIVIALGSQGPPAAGMMQQLTAWTLTRPAQTCPSIPKSMLVICIHCTSIFGEKCAFLMWHAHTSLSGSPWTPVRGGRDT